TVNGETGAVWRSTYQLLSRSIQTSYGPPSQMQALVPRPCSGDALLACLGNGTATYSSGWSWSNGASIWVQQRGLRLVTDAVASRRGRVRQRPPAANRNAALTLRVTKVLRPSSRSNRVTWS